MACGILSVEMLFEFTAGEFVKPRDTSALSFCDDPRFLAELKLVEQDPLMGFLYEHQREATAFMGSRPTSILADDMGLGKTHSSAAAVVRHSLFPCFVVCQAGMRSEWVKAVRQFEPTAKCDVPTGNEIDAAADFVVVPYSRVSELFSPLCRTTFRSALIDEAHFLKNDRNLVGARRRKVLDSLADGVATSLHRTQAVSEICRSIKVIHCLTGTPILSRPRELFNLLRLTRHPLGKNFREFSESYCNGHETTFGWNADGASHLLDLASALHNHVLRRTKEAVLSLPPKTVTVRKVELSPTARFEYDTAWTRYLDLLKSQGRTNRARAVAAAKGVVKPTLLRQITSSAKVAGLVEEVVGLTAVGEKVILFTTITETLKSLSRSLRDRGVGVVSYDGSTSEAKKQEAVDKFQNDPAVSVFCGNTLAAKTGITLTAASWVFFLDQCWTPGDHNQASDRAYRIGQKHGVNIVYLVSKDTIEEDIIDLLNAKQRTIDRLFASNDSIEDVSMSVEPIFMKTNRHKRDPAAIQADEIVF